MDRPSRAQNPAKNSKASARAALRAQLNGETGGSRADTYKIKAGEEDVYDLVDEDSYTTLVDKRRQKEDFVVDDDGLGYHDDGEEWNGKEDNEGDRRKEKKAPKRGMNASLDEETLKKARR
jgi:hypothetical protein